MGSSRLVTLFNDLSDITAPNLLHSLKWEWYSNLLPNGGGQVAQSASEISS